MHACVLSLFSRVRLCEPVDCTCQAPLSMDSPGKSTGVGCPARLTARLHAPVRLVYAAPCLGHCEQACYERWGACMFLNDSFVQI